VRAKFVALLLALFVGCSSGSNSDTGSGSDDDTTSKKFRIAVVPKGTAHEFWKSIHAGAAKAAQERDVEIIWKGPQVESDTASQIKTVQNFITKKVDGICLAPNHSQSLVEIVEEANLSNIPVVVFDSGLAKGATFLSYVATDNFHGGQLAADKLAETIGEQGDVLLMRYLAGSESTAQREEGFLDGISKYPNINVVSSDQYGGATTKQAMEKSTQLLLKYADRIQGIFCVNESNCNGMLEALENSGQAGKIKFIAFDASEKLVTGLKAQKVHGIVLQDPVAMGYQAVMTMVDHLEGKPVEPKVPTGEYVATPANIDSAASQRLLHPEIVD